LTRELIREKERLITSRGGQFVSFMHTIPLTDAEGIRKDGAHTLNGSYYRTSQRQFDENVNYINQGFTFLTIPVTVEQWRVGPENYHLNDHATDRVMKDLAKQLESRISIKK